MKQEIIELIVMLVAMTVGSAGTAMVLGIEKRVFWWAALCAFLAAAGFEIPSRFFGAGLFTSALISAVVLASYADIMAHWLKVPATVMIVPGIIPAVPGGRLYYTMLAAVNSATQEVYAQGRGVLLITAGRAVGIIGVTAISRPINAYISKRNQLKNKV